MQGYHFSMLGLLLDIVGVFFLSVEAIKVENLRALRDRILKLLHDYTQSPRVVVVDEEGRPLGPVPEPVPANRYPMVFMALHNVAGFLVLVILNLILDGLLLQVLAFGVERALNTSWYISIPFLVLCFLGGAIGGLWVVGELVHVSITKTIQFSIDLIDFMDARTPDGTVGIIGFVVLVAGFVLQIYGTYLAGATQ